jgi:membrane protein implicated in regulation of membrane protease activity
MSRLLSALLIFMAGFSSAHADLAIPVSEELYNMIAIGSGIFLAISFILLFILDRRNARASTETLRPRPKSDAEQKIEDAKTRLAEAIKKAGLGQ